jgi:3'-phosphoadenosine 5'-phosphosulfate sulfotransferase (PAPS reductase)/FAD synthetase
MKKSPAKRYEHKNNMHPILAQMADESRLRKQKWLENGCNGFDMKRPVSNPMSFWLEHDVLQYIKEHNIEICSVYGDIQQKGGQLALDGMECELCTSGCQRTGCIFCGYGCHLEKGETRFQRLKRTHPKQYDYCIGGGAYDPEDGLWKPDKNGLGMAHVFDELNKLYGEDFIRYK